MNNHEALLLFHTASMYGFVTTVNQIKGFLELFGERRALSWSNLESFSVGKVWLKP